tara:strand:+ start:80 stop:427 length:348 start_codon:yes stop_codon:yes gene_type:complete
MGIFPKGFLSDNNNDFLLQFFQNVFFSFLIYCSFNSSNSPWVVKGVQVNAKKALSSRVREPSLCSLIRKIDLDYRLCIISSQKRGSEDFTRLESQLPLYAYQSNLFSFSGVIILL